MSHSDVIHDVTITILVFDIIGYVVQQPVVKSKSFNFTTIKCGPRRSCEPQVKPNPVAVVTST